ncbi:MULTISPECIES: CrcB family protein [unclassified Thioalkalivibrio]|uniref:fluoride efflux transporter FluC n=1 Tax=unclassified Thioalkalivibrio TaxID=2621013 RepID=UPI00037CE355|nr:MULTISPECIES: CrcB family protein [unclassified Thioalkalivibrio]
MTGYDVRLSAFVALGAALGSMARYGLSWTGLHLVGTGFPWDTLAVNIAGSWLIGLYAVISAPEGCRPADPVTRQFVLAGFCGGFTTFSVFSLESLWLMQSGNPGRAALYVAVSLVLWIAGGWLGSRMGRHWNAAAERRER